MFETFEENGLMADGLRARKKAQTHRAIIEVATKAFIDEGFENVTLDDIALRANVGKRTLIRYFPTKVHLVLWGQYDALRRFKELVADRERTPIIDVWEQHVEEGAELLAKHGRKANIQFFVEDQLPIKQAYMAIQAEYQQIIFEGLLKDFGEDAAEIKAAVIASALVGANYLVGALYLEREDYPLIPAAEREVIQTVRSGLLR